jgi:hypothetical protein
MPGPVHFANSGQFAAVLSPWRVAAMFSTPFLGAGPDTLTLTGTSAPGAYTPFNSGMMLVFCPPISVTASDTWQDSNINPQQWIWSADAAGRNAVVALDQSQGGAGGLVQVRIILGAGIPTPTAMTLTLKTFTWNGVSPGVPIPTATPSNLVFTVNGHDLTAAAPSVTMPFAAAFNTKGVNVSTSQLTTTVAYLDFS